MPRKPTVKEGLKESKPKLTQAKDQSHRHARHIEETARLAISVETAKDPAKVRRTRDQVFGFICRLHADASTYDGAARNCRRDPPDLGYAYTSCS
jgi:hypothetical protein